MPSRLVRSGVLAAALASPFAAGPAAASCHERWVAAVDDFEEGPRMNASVCGAPADTQALIELRCAGRDRLMLRYAPGYDGDGPAIEPGDARMLAWTIGGETYPRQWQYEALDGMYAVYPPLDDALITALARGVDAAVSDPAGLLPESRFTLVGSSAAIRTVKQACG